MQMIRKANLADASAIAMVQVNSWRSTYAGMIPQEFLDTFSYEQRFAVWRDILSATGAGQCIYIAEDTVGNVVGFASGGQARDGDQGYDGELYAIYILESRQKIGLGRLMASKIATSFLAEGMHSMLVWVLESNPFRRFYETLGAKQFSERDITIGGTVFTEVAYGWSDLTLVDTQLGQ